jgi:isoquinoline 1-oxidoreductase beta subunit
VAGALGIRSSEVTIHPTLVGGGFGRRLANDFAVQAALIAKQANAPVKLIWSREEDIRRSTFRTMAKARLRAVMAADGTPELLRIQVATLHSYRRIGGLDDMAYAMPRVALSYAGVDTAVPIGSWRSVDMSQNTFFLECFLDECAAAAGQDPFHYRAALLRTKPRAIAVLDALRELSGWDTPPAPGHARGMAFAEGFGSLAGQVVEVRAEGAAGLRVTRVCCVLDCGFAVNPASVAAQVQGGVLYGLSAALTQQIELRNGGVLQSGFGDYLVMRSNDAPEIDVRILSDAANAPGGVGEPPVPPVAPALANAVARLRGQRPRSLPLLQQGAA